MVRRGNKAMGAVTRMRGARRSLIILIALSIPLLLAGCGSGGGDSTTTGTAEPLASVLSPASVSVTAGEETCTVSWQEVEGATTYKVYIALESSVSKENYDEVDEASAPPYVDADLQAGTTFYYVVTAIGAAGESAETPVVACTPELVAATTSPVSVTATLPEETIGTIEISWDLPSAEVAPDAYYVYRSTVPGINPEDPATYEEKILDADGSPCLDTGLDGRTSYYYVVTAVFNVGDLEEFEGMESAEVSAMPHGPAGGGGGSGGKPGGETAGNNLSFPVIWAEGVTKVLPGTAGVAPVLGGAWWYQWGTNGVDPDVTPASCAPDPDNNAYCDDRIAGQYDVSKIPGVPVADSPLPLAKAYLQKDALNVWQAGSATPDVAGVAEADGTLAVDWIDWGDNLESVNWYMTSQVRTEVVLFKDNPNPAFVSVSDYSPWLEYGMRHTSGWGINEVHGLEATLEDVPVIAGGSQATVYSYCARFIIQKLLVDDKTDPGLANLVWVPGEGWTGALVNEPIFNGSVHEGGDGPGYYSAEINVKGRIIYGYTWNVRRLNEGAGYYRLTFSLDEVCGAAAINTFFVGGITEIIQPAEEEVVVEAEQPPTGGGGRAVLDYSNNLTYIDILILDRSGGGGGGGGGGGMPTATSASAEEVQTESAIDSHSGAGMGRMGGGNGQCEDKTITTVSSY